MTGGMQEARRHTAGVTQLQGSERAQSGSEGYFKTLNPDWPGTRLAKYGAYETRPPATAAKCGVNSGLLGTSNSSTSSINGCYLLSHISKENHYFSVSGNSLTYFNNNAFVTINRRRGEGRFHPSGFVEYIQNG